MASKTNSLSGSVGNALVGGVGKVLGDKETLNVAASGAKGAMNGAIKITAIVVGALTIIIVVAIIASRFRRSSDTTSTQTMQKHKHKQEQSRAKESKPLVNRGSEKHVTFATPTKDSTRQMADNILASNPTTAVYEKSKDSSSFKKMAHSNPENIDFSDYKGSTGMTMGSVEDPDLLGHFNELDEDEKLQPGHGFHRSYITGEAGDHVDEIYEEEELFIKPQIITEEQKKKALMQEALMRPINDDRTAFEKKRGLNLDPKYLAAKYYASALNVRDQSVRDKIFGPESQVKGDIPFGVTEEYAKKVAAMGGKQFSGLDNGQF